MHTQNPLRRSRRSTTRLAVESLEDRSVPAGYTLTDLGVLANWNGYDINEAGQVVGTSGSATGQSRAFLWDDGMLTDLGTLGGGSSWAGGLNDAGQVVGHSQVSSGSPATDVFLWDGDVMVGLGIGGRSASGINDAGQVIGTDSVSAWEWRAFLWDDGVSRDLFPGNARATDINAAGQVAAEWESTRNYPVGAVWDPATGPRELPGLPFSVFSGAYALNDMGQVVGYSDYGDEMARPVLWDNGQVIDLGALQPNVSHSYAWDINNAGQIVGEAGGPFLWEDGVMQNLNDLVVPGSGLTLTYAMAINDAGQIVASGVDGQKIEHTVLLTPLPEDTPAIDIDDVGVTEGHTGTRTAAFDVTLSAASSESVTVVFATADGTARAGGDYQTVSGAVIFAPGETSRTITVPVIGDRAGELNETFLVKLSHATGGLILGDGQGVGTIVDDEPRISIGDVALKENNSGTTLFVFTVTLSAASDVPVTLNFATAEGTARASEDFDARSGTLTFAPGETTKTITIVVRGDKKKEGDETFFVNLSAFDALVVDGTGLGQILDDDRR